MEMPDILFIQLGRDRGRTFIRKFDTKSSFDGATVYVNYDEYQRVYEEIKQENEENCRLLGMSAERELALLSEIDRLKAKLTKTEWQPINKDTTKTEKILIGCWYEGKWYEDAGTIWGKQGRRTICVGFRKNEWPTHWMPLPAAPKADGKV